jgi:hypothetical protein
VHRRSWRFFVRGKVIQQKLSSNKGSICEFSDESMDYQQHVKKKKLAILLLQMLQLFCSVMQQQFLSAKVRKWCGNGI